MYYIGLMPTKSTPPATAQWAISGIFLACGMVYATLAIHIPHLRDTLHLDKKQVGVALLAVGVGSFLTMWLTGRWTARYGSDKVTGFAALLAVLSLLPPFFMPSYLALLAALLLLGTINGILDIAMNAQAVTVEKALGKPVMSRLHASYSLGNVLGAGVGTLLVGRVPTMWHVLGVIGALLLLSLWARARLIADPTSAPEDKPQQAPLSLGTLLLGLLCLLGMFAEGANYDWATLYFRDELGVGGGMAGLGYTAFVAAMTLGRIFGDNWRERWGSLRIVQGGALLTALGLGLALLGHQPVLAALGFVASGLGLSNVVPVMYSAAGHALGGAGIALIATIGYMGFLLGAPLIGFVAELTSLRLALGLALLAALLVSVLAARAFALLHELRSIP